MPKKAAQAQAPADCSLSNTYDAYGKNEQAVKRDIDNKVIVTGFQDEAPWLTQAELDAILPEVLPDSAYNEKWTREDEAALGQRWQADPRRTDPMVVSNPQMHKVFKILVRLFRVSPLEIISPKHRLEWDTVFQGANVHWSGGFCSNISEIAAHPLWEGNVRLLTIALQYAVILRTKDCRPWTFERPNDHVLFAFFKQVIEEYKDEGKDIAFIHNRVRTKLKRHNHGKPTFSIFLQRLEEQDIATVGSITDPARMVYAVAAIDVTRIKKALDEVRRYGHRVFYNTELIYELAVARRNSAKDKPSNNETKLYMERAWKAYRRIEVQFEKAEQERLASLASRPDQASDGASSEASDGARPGIQNLEAINGAHQAEIRDLKARYQAEINAHQKALDREKRRADAAEQKADVAEQKAYAAEQKADAAEQKMREVEAEQGSQWQLTNDYHATDGGLSLINDHDTDMADTGAESNPAERPGLGDLMARVHDAVVPAYWQSRSCRGVGELPPTS